MSLEEFSSFETEASKAGQSLGIAALVLGILGSILSFVPCFGLFSILFGVLAIVLGAVGISQAKKVGAKDALPKTGLILGIIATAISIIWFIFLASAGLKSSKMLEEGLRNAKINTEDSSNAKLLKTLD